MRLLRSHHITKLIAVVDVFLPRAAANPKGGRPLILHPNEVLTQWQLTLLHARPRIECVFDYLKEHLLLVTSFPRSVNGYAVHYIRTLLAYQLMWGF